MQDTVKPVYHPWAMEACQSIIQVDLLIQVDQQMTCLMFVCKQQC